MASRVFQGKDNTRVRLRRRSGYRDFTKIWGARSCCRYCWVGYSKGKRSRRGCAACSSLDYGSALQKKYFDIVWCHRVIQHTPNPQETLDHILQFVKDDGAAFVHSCARTWVQMWRSKYALWPLTKRINPEKLYKFVSWYAPFAYKVTIFLEKIPGGRYFNYFFVPFLITET